MNRLTEAPGPPDKAGCPSNRLRCEPPSFAEERHDWPPVAGRVINFSVSPDPCRGAPRRLGRARPGHISA
jgi:hypothetical protein